MNEESPLLTETREEGSIGAGICNENSSGAQSIRCSTSVVAILGMGVTFMMVFAAFNTTNNMSVSFGLRYF